MTINCAGIPNPLVEAPPTGPRGVNWQGGRTLYEEQAAKRAQAFALQAATNGPSTWEQQVTRRSQELWEAMVLDTAHRGFLSPRKLRTAEAFLANNLGAKLNLAGDIREPLLDIKRIASGELRDAAVYTMTSKTNDLIDTMKKLAARSGIQLNPKDARSVIEQGLGPSRRAVWGNTPEIDATITKRYNDFYNDFTGRGFTDTDIKTILNKALEVTQQFDEIAAIQQATGRSVAELSNMGYFPRQLTEEGKQFLDDAAALDFSDANAGGLISEVGKSRKTWEYLPFDHAFTSKMLGISTTELNDLLQTPADFAQFLYNNVDPKDLDLLVDSGVFSKIPMLSTDVNELLARIYALPKEMGVTPELFITDPLEAASRAAQSMRTGVEKSALKKYIIQDGSKQGWAIPQQLRQANPAYSNYVPLSSVPAYADLVGANTQFVHPSVAAHLNGIVETASSPAKIDLFARVYNSIRSSFAKQALGNPTTANAYLANQILSNMWGVASRGGTPADYLSSFIDIVTVMSKGTEGLDNKIPRYLIDGKPVTHRELVTRTLRMFSQDLIPGLRPGDQLLDLSKLDPRFTLQHIQRLQAAGKSKPYIAKELAKALGGGVDAVLIPALKSAQLLDLAGHLAVVRNKAVPITGKLKLAGLISEQYESWQDITLEVKRAFPMFDDLGKVSNAVSHFFPFMSWAMGNLPLQLKSMARNPSSWYNYTRMYSAINEQVSAGSDPVRGEFQQWELDKYGLILASDPGTRRHTLMFPGDFDPRLGVLGGILSVFDKSTYDDLRDQAKGQTGNRFLERIIGKSYFSGIYSLASGVDPDTGVRTIDYGEDMSPPSAFAGIPMPSWLEGILSLSPIAQSLDRLPALSGTRAVIDPRTGNELAPAVNGWLGTKGKLTNKQLTGVEQTLQFLGGRIRVVNGLANMQFTEQDTETALGKISALAFQEQKLLLQDLKSGAITPNSPDYAPRLKAIHKAYDTAIQLNTDLRRIQAWAVVHKMPSKEVLKRIREEKLSLDQMPLPGSADLQKMLEDAYQFKSVAPVPTTPVPVIPDSQRPPQPQPQASPSQQPYVFTPVERPAPPRPPKVSE
jgi:hypothetical protein